MLNNEQLSWLKYVKTYTQSEFIARSKYFRTVCLSKAGMEIKLRSLTELTIHYIHKKVIKYYLGLPLHMNDIIFISDGYETQYLQPLF